MLFGGVACARDQAELGEVTVPAGSSASFTFTVTCVNYPDADQSAYQGTLGCYRTVVSEIAE